MTRGKLIVFEGIDASGKSSQANLADEHYTEQGHKIYLSAEPTDGPAGRLLRFEFRGTLFAGVKDQYLRAGLFMVDRRDHAFEIEKRRATGENAFVDRYMLSSFAYQTVGWEGDRVPTVPLETLEQMHEGLPRPDLTLYIDVPVEVAMERMKFRIEEREKMERAETLEKVRSNYLSLVKSRGEEHNIVVIKGWDRNVLAVLEDCKTHIDRVLAS
jgi:dTMP kinase